nr:hypothetical protein [uncultured Chitinophaga sp.]
MYNPQSIRGGIWMTIALCSALLLLISSCQKNDLALNKNAENIEVRDKQVDTQAKYIETFSGILSAAVSKSPDLRVFIKQKALEQIDNDYDVFYNFVRNTDIGTGTTFRDELLKSAPNKDSFAIIESSLPFLTIFIPELPSGFNAATWNAYKDEPAIFSNSSPMKKS